MMTYKMRFLKLLKEDKEKVYLPKDIIYKIYLYLPYDDTSMAYIRSDDIFMKLMWQRDFSKGIMLDTKYLYGYLRKLNIQETNKKKKELFN